MIRPLTILTFLMACGSGLYLYQSKHEVQVLDRTIEKTVRETTALREQSRLLSAEWTMLNDPERLRQFSDTYLNMKSINPAQFTSLTDLDGKLPQVQVAAPAPAVEEEVPVAAQVPQQPQPVAEPEAAAAIVADEPLPVPPVPAPPAPAPKAPAVASVPRPTEPKLAVARPAGTESQPRPVVAAEARPAEQHPPEQRVAAPRLAGIVAPVRQAQPQTPNQTQPQRPIILAAPRPLPANAPAYQPPAYQSPAYQSPAYQAPAAAHPAMASATAPYGGSLLGMARGSMPQAPRPTPVNATYNTN
ncbi:MAG TPA: hypothetical protein DDZ81_03145 [Acetobacteraceae bacterium]|jgi:hypothetical protein|nr:hypothetical protein [Acetobacteraceae bacterium]